MCPSLDGKQLFVEMPSTVNCRRDVFLAEKFYHCWLHKHLPIFGQMAWVVLGEEVLWPEELGAGAPRRPHRMLSLSG